MGYNNYWLNADPQALTKMKYCIKGRMFVYQIDRNNGLKKIKKIAYLWISLFIHNNLKKWSINKASLQIKNKLLK